MMNAYICIYIVELNLTLSGQRKWPCVWDKILSGNICIEPLRLHEFHIPLQVSILLLLVDTLSAIIINKLFIELFSFHIEKFSSRYLTFLLPLQHQLTSHYNWWGECLLWGRNVLFMYYLQNVRLWVVKEKRYKVANNSRGSKRRLFLLVVIGMRNFLKLREELWLYGDVIISVVTRCIASYPIYQAL
jgi:hypothetical protein